MYLNAGGDTLIKISDIIGIFDMDSASMEPKTRKYLENAQKKKRLIAVTDDVPKAFIVTAGRGGDTVYLSLFSAKVLAKRTENPFYGMQTY